MKKCPTCDKTFEDSMRFCQTDGTPLVDDAPAFDPYATIVGQVIPPAPDQAADEPATEDSPSIEVAEKPAIHETLSAIPIAPPEDILEMPQDDPLRTMHVSDAEMKAALDTDRHDDEPEIVDVPPIEETPSPELPKFAEPDVPSPSFGDASPPPSPFAPDLPTDESAQQANPFDAPPPSASPFGQPGDASEQPMFAPPSFDEPTPTPSPFAEAETMIQPGFDNPFNEPAPAPVEEWTPPPAPDAQWQNQEIGSNTPFQPPAAGTGSLNQTLPIVSLVLGILSLCCYISPLTGLAALITGYMGMKNVKNDPANYGGKPLALAGMIVGGIFLLVGVLYWIWIIFIVGFSALSSFGR